MLWHGWSPALCACQGLGLWATRAGDVAQYQLEFALGACSLDNLVQWDVPEGIETEPLALALLQHPDVWSDVSKVTHEVAHIDSAAGFWPGYLLMRGFAGSGGGAWNLLPRRWVLLLTGVGCSVLSVVLCSLSSMLRFGSDSCAAGCCCGTRRC